MKRKITGLALLAATVVAAGCGGGDEEALSKPDYVKQGNKICADFDDAVGKDARKVFAGLRTEKDLTPEMARKFFDGALPKFEALVDDLAALAPPEDDGDTVQAIVDAGKSDSKKIEDAKDDDQAIRGFVLGVSATPEFAKKAAAYGLSACGTQG